MKRVKWTALALLLGGTLVWVFSRPHAHYIEPERVAMPPRWENIITHAPVQFQLGSHHYEVEVEYIVGQPFKGRQFDVSMAWPSMVSYMEGQMIARKTHDKNFRWMADSIEVRLRPIEPSGFHEEYETTYQNRKRISEMTGQGDWPIVKMEEIGLYKMTAGQEYYWPIDASVRTPLQGNPFMFSCDNGSETDTHLTCDAYYQLNTEVSVRAEFTKIHLKDWKSIFYKVQEFIKSIERVPRSTYGLTISNRSVIAVRCCPLSGNETATSNVAFRHILLKNSRKYCDENGKMKLIKTSREPCHDGVSRE